MSTSVDLCLQATNNRCNPFSTSAGRCVKDASNFEWPLCADWKAKREVHIQRRLASMERGKEICKGHSQHVLTNVQDKGVRVRNFSTSVDWCGPKTMRACNAWCCVTMNHRTREKSKVHTIDHVWAMWSHKKLNQSTTVVHTSVPRLTSAERYAYDTTDVVVHELCRFSDADFCWEISLTWSKQGLSDASCRWPRPMLPHRCAHPTPDAYMPWLMIIVVVQRLFPEVHILRLMLPDVGHRKYRLTIHKHPNRCVEVLAEVSDVLWFDGTFNVFSFSLVHL